MTLVHEMSVDVNEIPKPLNTGVLIRSSALTVAVIQTVQHQHRTSGTPAHRDQTMEGQLSGCQSLR